jgi:uncharacterized membrane protein
VLQLKLYWLIVPEEQQQQQQQQHFESHAHISWEDKGVEGGEEIPGWAMAMTQLPMLLLLLLLLLLFALEARMNSGSAHSEQA